MIEFSLSVFLLNDVPSWRW